ncbi:hypothetical protein GZ78_26965 [Endozoicomonas numazuensis]|uniref:Uncharacterized protein n=1 Tax=Endozoicomonas numazuensis TaxID=1137799 RepID=A0A081N410_9GAMM|nr:hypothetical protein GZ78_26965 [Endozoicomonas numazuensis]
MPAALNSSLFLSSSVALTTPKHTYAQEPDQQKKAQRFKPPDTSHIKTRFLIFLKVKTQKPHAFYCVRLFQDTAISLQPGQNQE